MAQFPRNRLAGVIRVSEAAPEHRDALLEEDGLRHTGNAAGLAVPEQRQVVSP